MLPLSVLLVLFPFQYPTDSFLFTIYGEGTYCTVGHQTSLCHPCAFNFFKDSLKISTCTFICATFTVLHEQLWDCDSERYHTSTVLMICSSSYSFLTIFIPIAWDCQPWRTRVLNRSGSAPVFTPQRGTRFPTMFFKLMTANITAMRRSLDVTADDNEIYSFIDSLSVLNSCQYQGFEKVMDTSFLTLTGSFLILVQHWEEKLRCLSHTLDEKLSECNHPHLHLPMIKISNDIGFLSWQRTI